MPERSVLLLIIHAATPRVQYGHDFLLPHFGLGELIFSDPDLFHCAAHRNQSTREAGLCRSLAPDPIVKFPVVIG
jgi:hypothetical protein